MHQATRPSATTAAAQPAGAAPMVPAMALALTASFGSVDALREKIAAAAAAGAAALRLVFLPAQGSLALRSDAFDDVDGAVTLLELDVAGGAAAAQASFARIDWAALYAAYQQAVHAASDGFGAERGETTGALLLDVRRAGVYAEATQTIAGAAWRDPALVAQWAAELPRGQPVVVACVYGHEVGRATALRLRAAGVDARFLVGGVDGWTAAGLPLQPTRARD